MLETDVPKRLAIFDALSEQEKVAVLWPEQLPKLPPMNMYPLNWADTAAKAVVSVGAVSVSDTSKAQREEFLTHLLRGLPMLTYGFHLDVK